MASTEEGQIAGSTEVSRRAVLKGGLAIAGISLAGPWTGAQLHSSGYRISRASGKAGGVLNIGIDAEMNYNMLSFSLTGDSHDYVYSWPIYESLFRPNAQGTVDPWLVESMEADPKGLTYTFHIRPGVTFSDGTTLTASVVKWNLDHYMKVGAKRVSLMGALKSTEVVDEKTVRLHLSTWSEIIPTALSREIGYMFSQRQYEKYGQAYCESHPVGTGPFVLTQWIRDVSKRFERNDKYWDGPVNLDAVTYTIYSDALVGQAAMISGEVDVYSGMPYSGVVPLAARGFHVAVEPLMDHCGILVYNSLDTSGTDPTGNLLVRQAISHAINTPNLVKYAYEGYGIPSTQFGVGTHYLDKNITGYPYDPDMAKSLLAQAGYPHGFSSMLSGEFGGVNETVLEVIQSDLNTVGITTTINLLSGAAGNKAETGWGSGMWFQTSSVYVNDAMQMASIFTQGLSGGVLGLTTMLRPNDVNSDLRKAVAALSDSEAVKDVGLANAALIDKYAIYTPIVEYSYLYVLNKKVLSSGIGSTFYSVATLSKAYLAT